MRRYLLIACFLAATGTPPSAGAQNLDSDKAGIWLDVPFIKQTVEGCGSASIAMLMQYWSAHGAQIAPEREDADAIQRQLYSRKGHGIYASDLEKYLRESGFRVFALRGEWSDLRDHLSKGRPLILSIEPGGSHAPLHYVVATGLDWEHEAVFVNDPARGKLLRIERAEFEKEWQAAKNYLLLAVPITAPADGSGAVPSSR